MAESPEYRLHRTVVLVGMMGSGKTAIGKALAAALNVDFVDSDSAIEQAAALSIAEIFDRDGEAFFRRREAEVLGRLLSGDPGVVSTGGGAFMSEENRKRIADQGVALWLNADLQTLWNRVKNKDTRPLLRTADPKETLRTLFEQRQPIYQQAGLQVKIRPDAAIDETTQSVIAALCARKDILEKV